MTHNRLLLLPALLLAIFASACVPSYTAPVKYKTSGTYIDSSGTEHPWSISDGHTLVWDGSPFVPVGGVFGSRCVSAAPTDENYQTDVADLEAMKARGISDVILASPGPITSTNPAAWQKIIDYLDANGFTYGIAMNDGPQEPLKGYLVAPNTYRLEGPFPETAISRDWPDVDSALYVVVKRTDNSIKTTGGATVRDGKVAITLAEPLSAADILIVYPHKQLAGSGDIWSGYGEYRDRVLAFFKKVKLGSGMRFFLEPFTSKMDFVGDMAGFLPDSSGFRLGLEAYLTRKYTHEGSVNANWGMNENLEKIEIAARLVPLWSHAGRGIAYAYDKASARLYPVDATVTKAWLDIIDYRDTSAQQFMNSIADALKKQVADVPVIFRGSNYHRIYANPFGIGGFDGLGVAAYGTGETPVTTVAGPVYSLGEESGKTTWFIVAGAQSSARREDLIGYAGEDIMINTLDLFREVGAKGFYIDRFSPQQLDWLKVFKDRIDPRVALHFKPEVVYFPSAAATGAYVKRLMPNTWWLPTLRTGKSAYIGDGLGAYTIAAEDRTYLWSGTGERIVTLRAGPRGLPSVAFPPGAAIGKKKDGRFTLKLTEVPTVLRGLEVTLAFPEETAAAQIERLAALVPEADQKGLDVRNARSGLERAREVLKNGQPMIAHGIAQTAMQELLQTLGSYTWLEGEASHAHNFTCAVAWPGASDGQALVLDTAENPPLMPYTASYRFSVSTQASFEIWLAATTPSDSGRVSYSMDGGDWQSVSSEARPDSYAPGLAWYKIGAANLFPGTHILRLRVEGRRTLDDRYYLAIDAVVLSPGSFKPNGVNKPY